MPYKIDYLDGDVVEWHLTSEGAEPVREDSYAPTIYVSAHRGGSLAEAADHLRTHPAVESVRSVEERISFRHDSGEVLRVDVATLDAVAAVAGEVSGWGASGRYRLYNIDLSREFRYCLEADVDPTPAREPTALDLAVPEAELANPPVEQLRIEDRVVGGSSEDVLDRVAADVREADPDVLRVNTAEIVPALFDQAERRGADEFRLGRRPGYQRLAGASTYESYGRVGHSPARYNLPGRTIVDESNTFFWDQTNLDGCLDLVARSRKPLQELSWSSIGNVLTAIQIREARRRGVLVPWHSWRHERFKTMRRLREADRGGFTFAPAVGRHEDVHELDFSSLYPNIIVTRNVSPETVRCDCHADREDVPGLGYGICDERGYLPDVLEPLIEDRDGIKAVLREATDGDAVRELEGRSNAIKWILVSCFGYQGFSNAKFGRVECHEAINAFAREILLDAKEILEANGWRVVHGIVDSLWVTAREGEEPTPLTAVAATVSDRVGVRLEYETAYDWIAFVPTRDSEAGALTRYFGEVSGGDGNDGDDGGGEREFTYRGIECRQRSTPPFVATAQRDLIEAVAEDPSPATACRRLRAWIDRLERGDVDREDLLVTNRVSKLREEYERNTRNAAALERAAALDLDRRPGEDVEYVVADDAKDSRDRVALGIEDVGGYDADFYRESLLRAAESVTSPLGWRRSAIDSYLADFEDSCLWSF